jgi:glycosyltransferase involved in cell wall biosynthesis
VTFAGRLIEEKGIRLLIKALPGILKISPEIEVQILGSGPLSDAVDTEIKRCSGDARVRRAHLADPAPALLKSSVFLSLQQEENYPSQALLEAMLAGNAIVATDVGLTHLLVDDATGFRIKTADELVAAVQNLFADPGLMRGCGEAARRKVLSQHTVQDFVTYLDAMYKA